MRAPPGAAAIHRKCGVYTRPEIVREILDGIGWTIEADLAAAKLLEPAAGDGAFIAEAAIRLILSMRSHGYPLTARTLADRINAFEFHPGEAGRARMRIGVVLSRMGLSKRLRNALTRRWITVGDFLLASLKDESFSHVAGNPPYIRWSKIPKSLRRKYERCLPSRMSRGDLFLPFLDLSIGYLASGARLGFVCSDRWRFMGFAERFRNERLCEVTIESERPVAATNAYFRKVDVYPSILILRRKKRRQVIPRACRAPAKHTLADAGYVVRVGPALGCTRAYVLEPDKGDFEAELLAPWIDAREIEDGGIRWSGRRVLALHDERGHLRCLSAYPRAAAHLQLYRERLNERAIVRAGAVWYRPIDRVIMKEWARPKLVIPEMAKIPRVAVDHSGAIPSHGVYAIFSPDDDVEKLYQVLKNGGLAQALAGIAPVVKGNYVRCYRRFLAQITI